MSSNYPTIQQHEPLRVPSGWGAQEKRLIAQLEEILDDLYSRFNRLKLSDMGKALQATIKDTERITLAVEQSMDEDGNITTLKNSKVEIDGDGIRMETSGAFKVFASDNDNSYIKFGGSATEPNFSLGEGGIVKARKVISDEYESPNGGIVALLSGSLGDKLIVSDTEPQNVHGVVWLQPAGTGGQMDFVLNNTVGEDMSGQDVTRTTSALTPQGTAPGSGTAYAYGVKLKVFNYSGVCASSIIDVYAVRGSDSSEVHIYHGTTGRIGVGGYFEVDTLDNPSMPTGFDPTTDLTGESSITLKIRINKASSTSARFEKTDFVMRCKVTGASSSGAQTCTVKYIP